MISNKERWIYFYDLKLTSYPEGSEIIPLNDLIKGIKKLTKDKEAVKFYRKQTAALRITDIATTNESITLLVQLADKNTSDPAFSDIQKGDIRVVEKAIGEGVAITAHVVISREPYINRNVYVAAIEKVPGISSGFIASFLTAMFKKVRMSKNYRWEDVNNRNVTHYPQVTASGHISETLKGDLEQGTLRGFEFISYDTSENDAFDTEPYLTPQEKVLKVGVSRFESGNAAWDIVKSAFDACKKIDYDKLKIKVNKEGNERWAQVDVTNDLESTAFTRHEKISLDNEIKAQCLKKINDEIKTEMETLICKEKD